MGNEADHSDFRVLSARLLDGIMPIPVGVVCLSAAYLAGENWAPVVALSLGYILANFWVSRRMVLSEWWIGWGRTAISLLFLPAIVYETGGGGYGWYVALPSVATLPFAFRSAKAVGPVALVIAATVSARLLAGATLQQCVTSTLALGTTSFITGALANALKRVVDRALRAERVQSDFLATMSHEIRTPMHGVLASLELMGNDSLSPAPRELLAAARASASGLLAIINDVLDFSKAEAGKLKIERVPFGLADLVRGLKHEFSAQAADDGTTFDVEVQPQLPDYLQGDPLRIAQVIRNYLSNALKFARGARVGLVVRGVVQGALCELRFEVTDAGPGIPIEAQPRLFGRFEQVSQGTARHYGGTGLGLAICRQLAELMGGAVGMSSVPGQGSCFWLTLSLPIANAPRAVAVKERLRLPTKLDVLVVDDNAVNRMVAARMLEALGCQATAVEGGREALELLGTRRFDCILMDCQMPELDGFETTRLIRARDLCSQVPIIAVTAGVLEEDRIRCEQAGMDGFLPKPMNKAALAGALSALVLAPQRAPAAE